MDFTRRNFVAIGLGALAATGAALPPQAKADQNQKLLAETPDLALGPYYPIKKPDHFGGDLVHPHGSNASAKGEVLHLKGRVLTPDSRPVRNATIELWQANAAGRYVHKGDGNTAPLDPNFEGYGAQRTDEEGRYSFLTIRPAAYPAGSYMRAAHIHMIVDGMHDRLITQMYFPGDPWLSQDRFLKHDLWDKTDPMPANIFGKLTSGASGTEAGVTLCEFDLVLADG